MDPSAPSSEPFPGPFSEPFPGPFPGPFSQPFSEHPSVSTSAGALAVLDRLSRAGETRPGILIFVLVGADAEVEGLVTVDDVPADPPQHERVRILAPLLRAMAREREVTGILLAVCRDGSPEPDGGDLGWHDAFRGAARVAGLTCHGTYVVASTGTRAVLPASPGAVA